MLGGTITIQRDQFYLKAGFPLESCSYQPSLATTSFPGFLASWQKWLCLSCQPPHPLYSLTSPAWPKLLWFMKRVDCDNFLVLSPSSTERKALLTMVSGHQPLECSTFSISSLLVTEPNLLTGACWRHTLTPAVQFYSFITTPSLLSHLQSISYKIAYPSAYKIWVEVWPLMLYLVLLSLFQASGEHLQMCFPKPFSLSWKVLRIFCVGLGCR